MGQGTEAVESTGAGQCHHWGQCPVPGPCLSCPSVPATLSLLPNPTEPLLSLLLLLQAMAGKLTKILLVLAILQHGLRAHAQAAQTKAEVLRQHEEQHSRMTWLAMARSITKVLMAAGIFQYALSVDLPVVKVTEELLRQHEEQRSQEMANLQKMEQRMQEQSRPTQESVLHSACLQWWLWNCVEIILLLFGIYWLPTRKSASYGSGSQEKATCSAQEQMEN
ncbi:PREDICTED: uncharacterized protein LOC101813459 [Ficedula albicollis]|uniref:uncharacterized protein LOC101813459 n=1 Tax=Ficedula albicollis TaxID=59894 RepID=UPI000359CE32|nr:PREDICTED: uncharacterized protein LOC101813459 [Ficedula albicollis]XP_005037328.1 PREDICTED: uncharacterized protein LOC101813459 [Ficedula albicollis]